MPLSRREGGETRQALAVHADRDDLDAEAGAEGLQRRREGVAVRAVERKKKNRTCVRARVGQRLSAAGGLLAIEDLDRARVHRPSLQRRASRSGVAQATRWATSEKWLAWRTTCASELHVAPDVVFARPDDRDVAVLLQALLQLFELPMSSGARVSRRLASGLARRAPRRRREDLGFRAPQKCQPRRKSSQKRALEVAGTCVVRPLPRRRPGRVTALAGGGQEGLQARRATGRGHGRLLT